MESITMGIKREGISVEQSIGNILSRKIRKGNIIWGKWKRHRFEVAKFLRVESLTTGTNRSVNGRVRRPGWNTKEDGKKEGRIYLIRIIAIRGDWGISINLRKGLRGNEGGSVDSRYPVLRRLICSITFTGRALYLLYNSNAKWGERLAERMVETLKREGSKRKGHKVGSTSSGLET